MTMIDPLEMEFYSLALIILEIITLQPPQDIDKVLRSKTSWDNIKNYTDAADYYGPSLVAIIKLLMDPPKDSTLTRCVQDYKQMVEDEEESPEY